MPRPHPETDRSRREAPGPHPLADGDVAPPGTNRLRPARHRPVASRVDRAELERALQRTVSRAVAEDLGAHGDLTSLACIPPGVRAVAEVVAGQAGVVAGLEAVTETFAQLDARVQVAHRLREGDVVQVGDVVARVEGPLRSILTGERTALNLLGHLSGVATATRALVDAVHGTGCLIRDTRQTTSGLRLLEKAAVVAGGGFNRRLGLHDALLIEPEHVIAAGGFQAAVSAARARAGGRAVEARVATFAELDDAIAAGVAAVLLDGFTPEDARSAVMRADGRVWIEVSGSIDHGNVRAYAEAGVDAVAVGAITHSVPWLDLTLRAVREARVVAQAAPPAADRVVLVEPRPAPAARSSEPRPLAVRSEVPRDPMEDQQELGQASGQPVAAAARTALAGGDEEELLFRRDAGGTPSQAGSGRTTGEA